MKTYFSSTLSVAEIIENLNNEMGSESFQFDLTTVVVTTPSINFPYTINGRAQDFVYEIGSLACKTLAGIISADFKKKYPHGYVAGVLTIVPMNKRIIPFELPKEIFDNSDFNAKEFTKLITEYLTRLEDFIDVSEPPLRIRPFTCRLMMMGVEAFDYHLWNLPFLINVSENYKFEPKIVCNNHHWFCFKESIRETNSLLANVIRNNVTAYAECSKIDESVLLSKRTGVHTVQLEQWTLRKIYVLYDNLFDEIKARQESTGLNLLKSIKDLVTVDSINLRASLANRELKVFNAYVHPSHILEYEVDGEMRLHIMQSNIQLLIHPFPGVMSAL